MKNCGLFVMLLISLTTTGQSANDRFIKVNIFGGSYPAPSGWNNWNVSSSNTVSALKYDNGTASTVAAKLSSGVLSDNGATYTTTMCPAPVGRITSYSTVNRTLTISGLNNSKKYNLEVYASRANTGNSTRFTIGNTNVTVVTDNNYSNKALFNNLTPSSGQIVVTIAKLNTWNYINGFTLVEQGSGVSNILPVAIAGDNQVISVSQNEVILNGSLSYDADSWIKSYKWELLTGPSPVNIDQPDSAITSVSGFAEGTYSFQLSVTDSAGAQQSAGLTVTVLPVMPTEEDSLGCTAAYKIVILGSSTPYGTGASPLDSGWAYKFANYVKVKSPQSEVINLSWPAYTTYHVLCPSGFIPPANRPVPDVERNITKALSYHPDLIIINLPSNDAALSYSFQEQKDNYERALLLAQQYNVKVWVASTQPRNNLTSSQMSTQLAMRDWTFSRFGEKAIDFWTLLANSNGTIKSVYDADGVHVNNAGHTILFNLAKAERMLDTLCLRPNAAPVANAGNDQLINLPATSVVLNGTASTDKGGVITDYRWTQIDGPSVSIITDSTAVMTTAANLVLGTYSFELTVTDDSLASAKDTILIIVEPAPVITQKFIKVNIFGGSYPAPSGWNNWSVSSSNTVSALKYDNGTSSGVSAKLSSGVLSDNGASYSTTMCPPQVGRITSYSTVNRTLTISGLNNSKKYNLEIYASRANTGNSTRFTVGNSSVTVVTDNNYSNKALFNNLTPSSGQIVLNIVRLNTWNYINGFTLIENNEEPVQNFSRGIVQPMGEQVREDEPKESAVTLFPNPLHGQLNLQLKNQYKGPVKLRITDLSGRNVMDNQFAKDSYILSQTILLQGLAPGVYILQVEGNGFSHRQKIIRLQ